MQHIEVHGAERAVEHRQKEDVGRLRSDAQGGRQFSQRMQSHAQGDLFSTWPREHTQGKAKQGEEMKNRPKTTFYREAEGRLGK